MKSIRQLIWTKIENTPSSQIVKYSSPVCPMTTLRKTLAERVYTIINFGLLDVYQHKEIKNSVQF